MVAVIIAVVVVSAADTRLAAVPEASGNKGGRLEAKGEN